MTGWLDVETKEFRAILEQKIEVFREFHSPDGFWLPNRLDEVLAFTDRALAIAYIYDVTVEQAAFALIATMRKLGWFDG